MIKALRVLRSAVAKLLRQLVPATLQRPRDLIERSADRFRKSGLIQRLRPGSIADRLLPSLVTERLRSGEDSPGEEQWAARSREADLPDVVAQADGLVIRHAVAVAVPAEIAYNQFTQFEDFPSFMRAIAAVEQVDATRVDFELRRWGIKRRWSAQIVDQRPEERIAWRSVSGMQLAGVTTFHSLADRLTWMDASVVVEPAGSLQRIAHRLGLVGRLIAHELQRCKAYVEMREEETGAWRGYVAEGEVVDENAYFGWERSNGRPLASPDGRAGDSVSAAGRSRGSEQGSGSRSRA